MNIQVNILIQYSLEIWHILREKGGRREAGLLPLLTHPTPFWLDAVTSWCLGFLHCEGGGEQQISRVKYQMLRAGRGSGGAGLCQALYLLSQNTEHCEHYKGSHVTVTSSPEVPSAAPQGARFPTQSAVSETSLRASGTIGTWSFRFSLFFEP